MILLAGLLVVVLSVPLTGRQLRRALSLRLRSGWLVAAALVCQTVIVSVVPSAVPRPLAEAIHLSTYAMAIAFVWRNRHIPWLWLISLGGGLNLAAIAANHGVMPASGSALAAAGIVEKAGFANSAAVAHAHLAFLGDVFAIPHGLPLANVFSVGDVVLLAGAALLLHTACRVPAQNESASPAVAAPVPAPVVRVAAAHRAAASAPTVAVQTVGVPSSPRRPDPADAAWDVVAFAVETVARVGVFASASA